MPTPYDVPTQIFLERLAKYIKDNIDQVSPMSWAEFAKTGSFAQHQPQNQDWWYVRGASLLRKIYTKGPIGIERLRAQYGGKKDYGGRPEHAKKGAGSNIRKLLQQFEAAGLVQNVKGKGRLLTNEGRRILDTIATEIKTELEKNISELAKY